MRSTLRHIALSVACLVIVTGLAAAAPQARTRTPRDSAHTARDRAYITRDRGPALKLIPAPRMASRGTGAFSFASGAGIVLANPSREDDRFAAGQLTEEVAREMGLRLGVTSSAKRPILLGLATDPAIAAECKRRRVRIDERIGEEGYVLQVSRDGIVVTGNTSTGVFYGVQTLKQLIRANREGCNIPCVRIRDWPGLR